MSQFVSNTISLGAVGVDRVTVQGLQIDISEVGVREKGRRGREGRERETNVTIGKSEAMRCQEKGDRQKKTFTKKYVNAHTKPIQHSTEQKSACRFDTRGAADERGGGSTLVKNSWTQ